MTESISGRFLSEGLSAAVSCPSQCREWCQNVFLLARVLFLGRARSRMVLNLVSKGNVDRKEHYFWPKTRESEATSGTARCRDEEGLGTNFALARLICKLSVKMLCTDPYEMLSSSVSSQTVIRLSERTSFATFCTFSSVFESMDIPTVARLQPTHFRF